MPAIDLIYYGHYWTGLPKKLFPVLQAKKKKYLDSLTDLYCF